MDDNEILRPYLPWLRVVAGNMTDFGHPDLPDLVQEGYIAMWRSLKTFNPDLGALDAWLKFKAVNRMRTLVGRRKLPDEELPVWSLDIAAPDLLEKIDIAYHHGEIAAAIDRLSPAQRRYVIARFWLGLTGNEMRELGVFNYDASALWNRMPTGARWKLQKELAHLR